MAPRTPLTLITGPLGAGKTTLLRHVLEVVPRRLAVVMNEFGEIAIDSRVIEGKHVRLAELAGGCVCCTLIGEFAAAVTELLDTADPELIVVETTGLAEPEALVFDVAERLERVRLDGVVAVADADMLARFPELGHTTRLQLEAADLIVLNKRDLVSPETLGAVTARLEALNPHAPVVATERSRVDPELLFGLDRRRPPAPPHAVHAPEFEAWSHAPGGPLDRACFTALADRLEAHGVYRAKGFVRFPEGSALFNYVRGRWDLEPFPDQDTVLVFIGRQGRLDRTGLAAALEACRRP